MKRLEPTVLEQTRLTWEGCDRIARRAGERLGISTQSVCNRLRALGIDPAAKMVYYQVRLPASAAVTLYGLPVAEQRRVIALGIKLGANEVGGEDAPAVADSDRPMARYRVRLPAETKAALDALSSVDEQRRVIALGLATLSKPEPVAA